MRTRRLTHEPEEEANQESHALNRADPALERHYSVLELSELWGLSEKTIRRIFVDEPGVVRWGHEERRFKRGYLTLRIPASVVQRVHRRLRQTD